MLFSGYISNDVKLNASHILELRRLSKEERFDDKTMYEIFNKPVKCRNKNIVKLNMANFSEYVDIINNAPNLEQLFLELLKMYVQNNAYYEEGDGQFETEN